MQGHWYCWDEGRQAERRREIARPNNSNGHASLYRLATMNNSQKLNTVTLNEVYSVQWSTDIHGMKISNATYCSSSPRRRILLDSNLYIYITG